MKLIRSVFGVAVVSFCTGFWGCAISVSTCADLSEFLPGVDYSRAPEPLLVALLSAFQKEDPLVALEELRKEVSSLDEESQKVAPDIFALGVVLRTPEPERLDELIKADPVFLDGFDAVIGRLKLDSRHRRFVEPLVERWWKTVVSREDSDGPSQMDPLDLVGWSLSRYGKPSRTTGSTKLLTLVSDYLAKTSSQAEFQLVRCLQLATEAGGDLEEQATPLLLKSLSDTSGLLQPATTAAGQLIEFEKTEELKAALRSRRQRLEKLLAECAEIEHLLSPVDPQTAPRRKRPGQP